ncbi:MAG: flagellar export protein FliJ [Proteobacteria bacterium]|nr:MAG: flagellar export protein FliJ [Pseudomonadota bacterium]
MRSLASVIRLHRWKVDEKRREVADLEAMAEALRQRLQDLEQEIEREKEGADVLVVGFAYAAYVRAALARRERFLRSITDAEAAVAGKRHELAEAFRELKKFEVAEARRLERAAAESSRRERAEADETALNIHRRRE